ncbi:MAG: hypothetical protein DWQ01_22130 [Planctomycetota bacterium]|nr:MAG: hypothetical protein DWQ01_22130 [Planctomycetota bacterium]
MSRDGNKTAGSKSWCCRRWTELSAAAVRWGFGPGRWLLAGLALIAVACGSTEAPDRPSEVAFLLDGMFLAPPVEASGPLLLCGRFEVTRGEFFGTAEASGDLEPDLPVTMVNREEAQAWARDRGLRLPTLREWRHLAVAGAGGDRRFPWGPAFRPAAANTLELGLHRPLPVGVFELGKPLWGGYDFAGNVWEWVAAEAAADPNHPAGTALACGGSFANSGAAAHVLSTRAMHAEDKAVDVGFRYVGEAETWLAEQVLPLWAQGKPADRRFLLRAISRWRPDLRKMLAEKLQDRLPGPLLEALREAGN